ncbi:mercuric reductase [Flavitalea sp. BT771]|uniref:mercuric reductase n=1 Tax=Flavitalea sp. BT771 TaxID=3063329 RepID=UPI0026E23775|nr:mercuric reductase [Flavitalea sp. BT771]MDO6433959.1 mercuric reductase [Flavitalea sp. BT771]MDV6222860.1 mercuric reductase [Flavitalea sp. BT771]
MTKYDAIIIGSGQAGNPLAKKLANAGWKVAVIERKWVAGTCVNVGCTPTKTMIASGRIAYLVKRSKDFGIDTSGYAVNMEEVVRRKNAVVLAARESSTQGLLRTAHLDLIFGNAVFTGEKEVTVTKEDGSRSALTANHIFINAGTSPVIPPVPGLEGTGYFTSDTIMDLLEVPRHLVIIGGSYIALEFGQLYRRLGSEVTIIEGNAQFLSKEDEDIAGELKKILEDDGIKILIHAKVTQVSFSPGSGGVKVDLTMPAGSYAPEAAAHSVEGTHLLLATGRSANTAALNPTAAGILLDEHGFIKVNDKLETNIPGIYALGDVKGGPQFTHISYNDHLIVYKNLVEKGNESIAGRLPIYCLFTDPELGRVGLTEKEARAQGVNVKVATLPADRIARAFENSETRGLLKAIVDADNKKIIGAAMLSMGGGELMGILQMAMMGGITYDRIRDAVFAHPTFGESLNNLFSSL